jgi:hypothetical protein
MARESMNRQMAVEFAKGSAKYDPAQNSRALRAWEHLQESVNVNSLRFTHDRVSDRFLHGRHQNEPVASLTEKLISGEVLAQDITPLVVVGSVGKLWVVFGNRRLKALKDFNAWTERKVQAFCIVHRRNIPAPLMAKLLISTSTENGGTFAPFRRRGGR